jgi:hypothetical protein
MGTPPDQLWIGPLMEDIAKCVATTIFAGICVMIVLSFLRLAGYF